MHMPRVPRLWICTSYRTLRRFTGYMEDDNGDELLRLEDTTRLEIGLRQDGSWISA